MTWMKTDFDFGMPYAIYTIGIRQAMIALQIRNKMKELQESPDQLALALENIVAYFRPTLKGGSIICIRMGGGMNWEIGYCHPSLPKVASTCSPLSVKLVPCPGCGKDMVDKIDAAFFLTSQGEVCSQECADSSPKQAPDTDDDNPFLRYR